LEPYVSQTAPPARPGFSVVGYFGFWPSLLFLSCLSICYQPTLQVFH
jgi:hypothetical protein